jgi:cytochrome c oxidase subunit 3
MNPDKFTRITELFLKPRFSAYWYYTPRNIPFLLDFFGSHTNFLLNSTIKLIWAKIFYRKLIARNYGFYRVKRRAAPRQKHLYHLVTSSPWPFFISVSLGSFLVGCVMYLNFYIEGYDLMTWSFFNVILVMFVWWRDISREGTLLGHHTSVVRFGLKLGFLLFIVSEIMFFVSWFWAFFHSSLAPAIQIGSVWPPLGIECINPFHVPFLNTLVLLTSGLTVTWSHHAISQNNYNDSNLGLLLTILLGLDFTFLQYFEYLTASFFISDSVYGSVFYMTTGFHGFHVICGTFFLFICWIKMIRGHYTCRRHLSYEFAIWYWHFVDVVWLFVYSLIYCWGSNVAQFL